MNLLEKFFGPAGARDFLQNSWPCRVKINDGELSRLGEFAQMPEFKDIKLLLQKLNSSVDLVFPDGKRLVVSEPTDALPVYRQGAAMLYLKNLENIPLIASSCDELARLLCVPRQYVSCEGFAAVGAVNVPAHFDHETNFMVQVHGDKTWVFAENTDLPNPLFPYFPANRNRYYAEGRNPFTGKSLPVDAPLSCIERVVHAGTVTFMPRGFWHSTRTHERSFAIGFVINPPTLAEIALSALLARLHSNPAFRAHPLGASTHAGRADLLVHLGRLLDEIGNCSGSMSADSILDDYLNEAPGNSRPLNHPR